MEVRRATRDDLAGIAGLLYGDYFRDISSLLSPKALGALAEHDFSSHRLKRQLLSGGVLVAIDGPDLVGFAIVEIAGDHLDLQAICTRAEYLHQGVAKHLLDEVQLVDPTLSVAATVMLGNVPAEEFHESQGFVPGESVDRVIGGQAIVERRWWRPPA